MDDKKKPANWDQMTKEQLEKYFDDKKKKNIFKNSS